MHTLEVSLLLHTYAVLMLDYRDTCISVIQLPLYPFS